MSCCTANAWGDLKNQDYKEKGQVEKVDDLEIYRVGSSSNANASSGAMMSLDLK